MPQRAQHTAAKTRKPPPPPAVIKPLAGPPGPSQEALALADAVVRRQLSTFAKTREEIAAALQTILER